MKYTFNGFAYPDHKPVLTTHIYAKTQLAADERGRELEMDVQRINIPCFYRLVSATGRLVREEATLCSSSDADREWLKEAGFCIPACELDIIFAMKDDPEAAPHEKSVVACLDPLRDGAAPWMDVLLERAKSSGLMCEGGRVECEAFVVEEGGTQ